MLPPAHRRPFLHALATMNGVREVKNKRTNKHSSSGSCLRSKAGRPHLEIRGDTPEEEMRNSHSGSISQPAPVAIWHTAKGFQEGLWSAEVGSWDSVTLDVAVHAY